MNIDPLILEAMQDAILEELEDISVMIYEQRVALDALERELAEARDTGAEWSVEH